MRSGKKREGEKEKTYYDVVPLISQQPQQQQHCFSCGEVIRLKRKADNSAWIRLNLDNTTEHQCIKKKKQQLPVITGSASTAAPLPVASGLERKLDALIEEVQALRLELQKRN